MTDGEVQVVLLEPPDALSEEAAVKTCWKRCTAKKAVWCGFGDYILHWVLSVVVFKKNKIIIIRSRKGTDGLTLQFPCFIFFRLFSCSSYTRGAFTIYIGEHR